jgi:hypothetical protein
MIDSITLYNYGLPGESLPMNETIYPVNSFTTEVDTRYSERVRPTEHGIWVGNTFFGKRLFHIEGDIMANDSSGYNAARRELLRMLTPKSHMLPLQPLGYMEIQFTGVPELLTCDFTIDSYPEIPMEGLSPARGRYQVNLKCFDPRMYGLEQQVYAYPPVVQGRSYAKTYNKTYAVVPLGAEDNVINNTGDIETYPTVLFYGPTTGPRAIRRLDSGTLVTFELPGLVLSATDVVEADFAKKTIKNLITNVNLYNYQSGDWWTLEPGANTVRANASSAGTGSFTVFKWNNGYLM